jgi:2-polyprenyl-3-methyl-5-hydroxy-6-metoxy-1,4-benzoquinol methylase
MKSEDLAPYFSGEKLYGDDFSLEQIEQWFEDEQEGYADLGAGDRSSYQYSYHQLNIRHGYSKLRGRRFQNALGIGSAYGDEFQPIVGQLDSITVLDPSDSFADTTEILGVPCQYQKPNVDGKLSFPNQNFDLITCLGVMHHIPNVSQVMKECYRCLSDDGVMLIREPIVSMGDWSKPRRGLTKRERGIPLKIFEKIALDTGFKIKRKTLCVFPVVSKIGKKLGKITYNDPALVWLDRIFCKLFFLNTRYHRTSTLSKFGPASAYFILEK